MVNPVVAFAGEAIRDCQALGPLARVVEKSMSPDRRFLSIVCDILAICRMDFSRFTADHVSFFQAHGRERLEDLVDLMLDAQTSHPGLLCRGVDVFAACIDQPNFWVGEGAHVLNLGIDVFGKSLLWAFSENELLAALRKIQSQPEPKLFSAAARDTIVRHLLLSPTDPKSMYRHLLLIKHANIMEVTPPSAEVLQAFRGRLASFSDHELFADLQLYAQERVFNKLPSPN